MVGSWCGLYFGNEEVLSSKSYPITTDFFTPQDKVISTENTEDGESVVYKYTVPIFTAIERLQACGATLDAGRESFERYKAEVIADFESRLADQDRYTDVAKIEKSLELIKVIDFDAWGKLIQRYMAGEKTSNPEPFTYIFYVENEIDFLFLEHSDFNDYGLSSLDNNAFLAILSTFPDKLGTFVTMEYSELVHGGYVDAEEDLSSNSPQSKTVILTEGVTDRRYIEASLQILKPHLASCYSFLDFEENKLQGSASSLIHTIKALSAAGISNDIVAVFDNDTAAKDSMKYLKELKLRKNIRIVSLPDIDLLKNYPTVGPQGSVDMDVNGLAGSIELYFPVEALRHQLGMFHPVIWKGFIEGQKKYQGEVSRKADIQASFDKILLDIKDGRSSVASYDFGNMMKVLETICGFSFHKA
ncbi:HEPN/Toprim-associated domain-containing protein [Bdellovibrio sp. GT3]|uniref:HEPN/Toprim-associated domain-containing protein n=1 Tax=Bdellovibrio sp. GT3 TaxID=3136282 RepID=UPI0030EFD5E5